MTTVATTFGMPFSINTEETKVFREEVLADLVALQQETEGLMVEVVRTKGQL